MTTVTSWKNNEIQPERGTADEDCESIEFNYKYAKGEKCLHDINASIIYCPIITILNDKF